MATAGKDAAQDGKAVTIFVNPEDYTKHPLQHSWTLYFDNPALKGRKQSNNWEESLEKIYIIKTIEDFWGVWNNILKPQEIPTGSTYHFFKDGIKPMWEDPENKAGGKWVYVVPKQQRDRLNGLWLHSMLCMIGEQFDEVDGTNDNTQVTGAVFSCRNRADKMALWTKNAEEPITCRRIGNKFKSLLECQASASLGYQGHQDALRRNSSFTNSNKYTV